MFQFRVFVHCAVCGWEKLLAVYGNNMPRQALLEQRARYDGWAVGRGHVLYCPNHRTRKQRNAWGKLGLDQSRQETLPSSHGGR